MAPTELVTSQHHGKPQRGLGVQGLRGSEAKGSQPRSRHSHFPGCKSDMAGAQHNPSRSHRMREGRCSAPCQRNHFEARHACSAWLVSPMWQWRDLRTPLPCSPAALPAAPAGRHVKPPQSIQTANPAWQRYKEKINPSLKQPPPAAPHRTQGPV